MLFLWLNLLSLPEITICPFGLGASVVAQMVKNPMQETRFDAWVGKIPWRRKWQSTPVILPGKSNGQRSLVGYSPWGRKESDTTGWLHFHFTKINESRDNLHLTIVTSLSLIPSCYLYTRIYLHACCICDFCLITAIHIVTCETQWPVLTQTHPSVGAHSFSESLFILSS